MPEAAATNGAQPPNATHATTQLDIVKQANAPTPAPATPPAEQKPPEPDARLKELEAQTKRFAQQQRKHSEDRQALEKKAAELEAKEKEFQEWKQLQADRVRNPIKYYEKELGPDWYDKMTQMRLQGIPAGDLVASELDAVRSDLTKQLQAERQERERLFHELQKQEQQRAIDSFHAEIASEVKRNIEKYPGVEAFSEDPTVWESIKAEIDHHFHKNKQAILDGDMPMLTADEAATTVSKRIEAFGQRFETYRSKKQQPSATPTPGITPPQRRTLSTDMTASSGSAYTPPKDDKERLERAKAAMEAARRK